VVRQLASHFEVVGHRAVLERAAVPPTASADAQAAIRNASTTSRRHLTIS
jgi:hypothetical protein